MPEVCRFDHVGVPVPMLEVDFPSGLEMDCGDVLWGPEALGESTGDTRVYSYVFTATLQTLALDPSLRATLRHWAQETGIAFRCPRGAKYIRRQLQPWG